MHWLIDCYETVWSNEPWLLDWSLQQWSFMMWALTDPLTDEFVNKLCWCKHQWIWWWLSWTTTVTVIDIDELYHTLTATSQGKLWLWLYTSKWLWMKDITDYLAQWLMRLWNGLGKPCCVLTFKVNLTNTLSLLVQRVLQWLKGACSGLKPDMWHVKLSTTCWRPSWARFLWTGGYIGTTPNVQRRRLVRCRLMVRFSVPSPTTWGSGWVWGCTEHDKCGDCNANWHVHCELVQSMAQDYAWRSMARGDHFSPMYYSATGLAA